MKSSTLYLKIAQITEIGNRDVYLKDIAEVYCQDGTAAAKAKSLKVVTFPEKGNKPLAYVGSIVDLAEKIEAADPNVEINSLGENDFIIKYRPKPNPPMIWEWLKTLFVAAVSFCGAAFAIMTFNNDANVSDVFGKLYFLATGLESDGVTVLEISYSIGLALGILVFFNHFASWKITVDPTPIEVEMRLYEESVNKTLIQNHGRKESGIDVS